MIDAPFVFHIFSHARTNKRQIAMSTRPVRNIVGIQNSRFIRASSTAIMKPLKQKVIHAVIKRTLNLAVKTLKIH
jgi:chromosomal replication initiation ATPase DnaA